MKTNAMSSFPTLLRNICKGLKRPDLVFSFFKRKFIRHENKVNLRSIFGCDFWQNNKDICYSEYDGLTLWEIRDKDPEFDVMATYAKLGSIVIDIGANVGFYSLGLSKLVGKNGAVYAFEPGPISFAILSRNVYSNTEMLSDNVILNKMAVSDRVGLSNLFINTQGESDNQLHHDIDSYEFKSAPEEKARPKIVTEVISLDVYFQKLEKDKISFIKIDTQGHEYYVLKGAKDILSSSRNIVLLIEYAPYLKAWKNFTQDEFYCLVKEMGFNIYDIVNKDNEVDNNYLKKNYSPKLFGKWTSLILRK